MTIATLWSVMSVHATTGPAASTSSEVSERSTSSPHTSTVTGASSCSASSSSARTRVVERLRSRPRWPGCPARAARERDATPMPGVATAGTTTVPGASVGKVRATQSPAGPGSAGDDAVRRHPLLDLHHRARGMAREPLVDVAGLRDRGEPLEQRRGLDRVRRACDLRRERREVRGLDRHDARAELVARPRRLVRVEADRPEQVELAEAQQLEVARLEPARPEVMGAVPVEDALRAPGVRRRRRARRPRTRAGRRPRGRAARPVRRASRCGPGAGRAGRSRGPSARVAASPARTGARRGSGSSSCAASSADASRSRSPTVSIARILAWSGAVSGSVRRRDRPGPVPARVRRHRRRRRDALHGAHRRGSTPRRRRGGASSSSAPST